MKQIICGAVGAVGSAFIYAVGGWDHSLVTLLMFMGIDYITGLIVAGVFHTSRKTDSGALESRAGFKGLIKKCMVLVFVIIAHRVDLEAGTNYFRDAVCLAFITNELISIIENAGLMGIYIPEPIAKAVDILTTKGEKENA